LRMGATGGGGLLWEVWLMLKEKSPEETAGTNSENEEGRTSRGEASQKAPLKALGRPLGGVGRGKKKHPGKALRA